MRKRGVSVRIAAGFVFLSIWQACIADDLQTSRPFLRKYDVTKLPRWEAGIFAGGISQPAYPGAEDRVSLISGLPFVIYRGDVLRIDRGSVGVRALKTPRTELDVGFAASLGSHADRVEARQGMADLGTLVEFGPRLKINLGIESQEKPVVRLQFPVRGVFDLDDHLAYRGMAGELQWVADAELPEDWVITGTLGWLFADQQLADTYYRVAPFEATVNRPAYAARAGLVATRLSLLVSRLYDNDARLFGYARLDSVAGAANRDSPLVRQEMGWTMGVGLAWTLSHSVRFAAE